MFTRLPIPTPFQVGAVNTYLAGRTVVDPGPASEEAWSSLLTELEERDLVPGDIERVLITHPHMDHFGLSARFRADGARVLASERAAEVMADHRANWEREREFFTDFFARNGMSHRTAGTVTGVSEPFLTYAPSVETDRTLSRGDTVTVDGTDLAVDEVAGHAPGELLFAYDCEGERRALVGDNVLEEITPNPVLQPPREQSGERPRVLPAFNDSLERLREEGYDRFLPGHRGIIENPAERIAEIREAHEERTDNVRALLDGPTTAVEVMEELFGDLPVTEQFSGMSEAVGHLDVLAARDEVTRREDGGMVVHEPTG